MFDKGPVDIQTNTWPMIGAYQNGVYKLWPLHSAYQDPDFWRCLGKVLGWEEEQDRKLFYCRTYRHPERDGDTSGGWIPESLYHQYRFIDHLADEGTPESFFKEL